MNAPKTCLSCKTALPRECFARNRRKADGLDIYCRNCTAMRSAAHYVANRDARKAQHAAWLATNPGKSASYSKAWRDRNPGAQAASERTWYERNRAEVARKDREGRLLNLDSARAKDRQRYAENRDAMLAKNKAWRQANPARIAALAAERRAAKRNATPPWFTQRDRDDIAAMFELARVLTKASGVQYHVDHIVPLRGRGVCGLHVAWNMQCLPAVENLRKNNRLIEA